MAAAETTTETIRLTTASGSVMVARLVLYGARFGPSGKYVNGGRALLEFRRGDVSPSIAYVNSFQIELFEAMLNGIKADVVKVMMNVQVKSQQDVSAVEEAPAVSNVQYQHAGYDEALAQPAEAPAAQPFVRAGEKVGRNGSCPCGSGKKYKHCHGKLT